MKFRNKARNCEKMRENGKSSYLELFNKLSDRNDNKRIEAAKSIISNLIKSKGKKKLGKSLTIWVLTVMKLK